MTRNREAFRSSWERWGKLADEALSDPGVLATPGVHAALSLIAEAIVGLVHDVDGLWPAPSPSPMEGPGNDR